MFVGMFIAIGLTIQCFVHQTCIRPVLLLAFADAMWYNTAADRLFLEGGTWHWMWGDCRSVDGVEYSVYLFSSPTDSGSGEHPHSRVWGWALSAFRKRF